MGQLTENLGRIGEMCTAVLPGPAGAAVDVCEVLRHGMGALAGKLGRGLCIGQGGVGDRPEVVTSAGGVLVLHLVFQRVQTVSKLFYISGQTVSYAIESTSWGCTYPLLGPRFIGCLLNWQRAPVRLQLEQASGPFSLVASHRIWEAVSHAPRRRCNDRGAYLFAPALVAGARDFGALPARAVMVAEGVFVQAHDRLRRLRHVLGRVRRPRGRLKVVVDRIHLRHLVRRRAVEHLGALL